ncbi:MAG: hypothetical protein AAF921_08810 [Cyanobacteria bacterium P01_D01_bin.44]
MQKSLDERGPFGQFLYLQLKNHRQRSAQWLADELEKLGSPLDSSLIRHWMSGSRVPQEGNEVILKIAQVLNFSEAEMRRIHKAALEWNKQEKKARLRKTSKAKFSDSTNLLTIPVAPLVTGDKKVLFDGRKSLSDGQNSIGIEGARFILETAICLLENLPNPQKLNDEVLLMIQGRIATFETFAEDLQPRWYEAVKSALQKGWRVIHVVRIDDDLERIKKMVRGILLMVGQVGEYRPYAFKQKYVLPVAESFLLVPSIDEGMIFYAGGQARYADSAIYFRDKTQIHILKKHFKQLQQVMNPIFCIWKRYIDVISRLERADGVPGERIVILKRLSEIQRPNTLYNTDCSWAKSYQTAHNLEFEELCKGLEFRQSRQKNLKKHSLNHSCKYIFTRKCIERYVHDGYESSIAGYVASISERIAQLKMYQEFLKHPSYEMALSEEAISQAPGILDELIAPAEISEIIPNFCEVLENYLVLMQIQINRESAQHIESKWIVIEEPIIVNAFYQYLLDIWETKIPKSRKDKFHISNWLKNQKKILQK